MVRAGFLLQLFAAAAGVLGADSTILLEEKFEDANFAVRGWYDNTAFSLSTAEHIRESTKSAEFRWRRGGTTAEIGAAMRRKFRASDAVYVSYWVKYSTNYTGSNKPYHPHEFLLMTTENGDYDGPAFSHLTGYIEQNEEGRCWRSRTGRISIKHASDRTSRQLQRIVRWRAAME